MQARRPQDPAAAGPRRLCYSDRAASMTCCASSPTYCDQICGIPRFDCHSPAALVRQTSARLLSDLHALSIRAEMLLPLKAGKYLADSGPAEIESTFVNAGPETLQNGGAAFVTTHWSVVLTAQGGSPAAEDALEQLCRIYWRPIYSFLRREGRSAEDAQDLTQGFFAQLLERGDFAAVRQEKGRLRSYLLGSLKHFLANDRRRAMSLKRGEGRTPISLDELRTAEGVELESQAFTADRIYDRRWALTVLDQAFASLTNEYRHLGHPGLFERLSEILSEEPGRPSQAEIAREFGMTENAVKQAFHRLRQRYRQLLREEIAHTVATPAEIEDELRELIVALRA